VAHAGVPIGGGYNGQYQAVVEKHTPFPFNVFMPAATR